MRCPTVNELPPPPPGKTGWPFDRSVLLHGHPNREYIVMEGGL